MSFGISIRKVWLFIQSRPLALMLLLMTNYMRDSSVILTWYKRNVMGLILNCYVLIQLHQILWCCTKVWLKIVSLWIPVQWGWSLYNCTLQQCASLMVENICSLWGHLQGSVARQVSEEMRLIRWWTSFPNFKAK